VVSIIILLGPIPKMPNRDEESQAIMAAAMRFVKSDDRSDLESYPLALLKKADYQLGNRDIGSGYRKAVTDLITELMEKDASLNSSDNYLPTINEEKQKTKVDKIKRGINDHPLLAPIIVIGIIVVGVGSFTDALNEIFKFFETHVSTPEKTHQESYLDKVKVLKQFIDAKSRNDLESMKKLFDIFNERWPHEGKAIRIMKEEKLNRSRTRHFQGDPKLLSYEEQMLNTEEERRAWKNRVSKNKELLESVE